MPDNIGTENTTIYSTNLQLRDSQLKLDK